jgi:hypothetical protein
LLTAGAELCVAAQNIAEFWCAATRPADSNGLGLSFAVTAAATDQIEQAFRLLPDDPAIYGIWKSLVTAHQVVGMQICDARLVAVMQVHRLDRI